MHVLSDLRARVLRNVHVVRVIFDSIRYSYTNGRDFDRGHFDGAGGDGCRCGSGGASCGLLGCALWDGVVDGRGGGEMAGGRWRL